METVNYNLSNSIVAIGTRVKTVISIELTNNRYI